MHIVANSDAQEDQDLKLQVRDAVTAYLTPILENMPSREEAEAYLREHLEDLKAIAQQVLSGTDQQVTVKLEKEAFPKREYDTFTLPAGTYEAVAYTHLRRPPPAPRHPPQGPHRNFLRISPAPPSVPG